MPSEPLERRLAALLSADAVGYSRLMAEDDIATVRTLEVHRGAISALVATHRGRVVDTPGDNLLAEFPSASDAVRCAQSIQAELGDLNAEHSEQRRLEYRIGMHLGEVISEGDRVYGDGVNVAARLQRLAEPGGVCVSGAIRDQVQSRPGLSFERIGSHQLKNIPYPVEVFRIAGLGTSPARPRTSPWRPRLAWVGGALVLLAAAAFWLARPAAEVSALPTPTPRANPPASAIVVLPFADLSPGTDHAYFSLGMTEELIHRLVQDPRLDIVARTSAFSPQLVGLDVREIAARLGVGSVVEGSVRKSGERLRITAQLIRASDGFHLWSGTYDRNLADVLATQSEVAATIGEELQGQLGAAAGASPPPGLSVDPLAYDDYLKGRALWRRRPEGLVEAEQRFERALLRDPTFALGHAGLADAVFMRWHYDPDPASEEARLERATLAAKRAVELDRGLAEPHVTLAMISAARREHDEAERLFRRALELAPGDANAHHQFGGFLTRSGRFDEALEHMQSARALDPLSPVVATDLAFLHLYRGDLDGAVRVGREALALRPGDEAASFVLTNAYAAQGLSAESLEAYLARFSASARPLQRLLARVFGAELGTRLQLEAEIRRTGRACTRSPYEAALALAFLGADERLYECLEEAIARNRTHDLAVAPAFAAYRGSPRFRELLERAGIPVVASPR